MWEEHYENSMTIYVTVGLFSMDLGLKKPNSLLLCYYLISLEDIFKICLTYIFVPHFLLELFRTYFMPPFRAYFVTPIDEGLINN